MAAEDAKKQFGAGAPLAEFLSTQRNNGACWCESTPKPLIDQVNQAVRDGSRQWAAMRRWLEVQGVVIPEGRFDGHFRKNHHV